MIDVENELFNEIYDTLTEEFGDINITGDYVATPESFPCASIYEADNYTYKSSQDSGSGENHVNVMYEVYVFSNKRSGKKTECKQIFSVIDEKMIRSGFSRVGLEPIYQDDGRIFKLIGRYEAVVSQNKTIFRR